MWRRAWELGTSGNIKCHAEKDMLDAYPVTLPDIVGTQVKGT